MFHILPKTTLDLPESLPVFPLTGALILPKCKLPLNIFEPRYLAMVDAALRSARLIGMIQPQPGGPADGTGPLYGTGCAGRITGFQETDDGRYLINMTGVCRFNVVQELEPVSGYRIVQPDWLPFATDLITLSDKAVSGGDIVDVLQPFLEAHGIHYDWPALKSLPGPELLDVLTVNLPFAPEDKQALLEAHDHPARLEVMRKIAAIYAAGRVHGSETKH
ncbi:MAG: LON peptidase substrate-binding domain-containing protein [Rickettsiales bacterium]